MKLIILEKSAGKTTKLVKLSVDTGFTIVCLNKKQAFSINAAMKKEILSRKKYDFHEYFEKIDTLKNPPITFDEFISKSYIGQNIKGFLIDDADMLLQILARNVIIDTCTFTA